MFELFSILGGSSAWIYLMAMLHKGRPIESYDEYIEKIHHHGFSIQINSNIGQPIKVVISNASSHYEFEGMHIEVPIRAAAAYVEQFPATTGY